MKPTCSHPLARAKSALQSGSAPKPRPTIAPHLRERAQNVVEQRHKMSPTQALPLPDLSQPAHPTKRAQDDEAVGVNLDPYPKSSTILKEARKRMAATKKCTPGGDAIESIQSTLARECSEIVSLALRLLMESDLLHLRSKIADIEPQLAQALDKDSVMLSEVTALDGFVSDMVHELVDNATYETGAKLSEFRIHNADKSKTPFSCVGFIIKYHGNLQLVKENWQTSLKNSTIVEILRTERNRVSLAMLKPFLEKRIPHKIKKKVPFSYLQFLDFFKGNKEAADRAWDLGIREVRKPPLGCRNGCAGFTYAQFLNWARGNIDKAVKYWNEARCIPPSEWENGPLMKESSKGKLKKTKKVEAEREKMHDEHEERRIPQKSKTTGCYTFAEFVKWADGDTAKALEHWNKAKRAPPDAVENVGVKQSKSQRKKLNRRAREMAESARRNDLVDGSGSQEEDILQPQRKTRRQRQIEGASQHRARLGQHEDLGYDINGQADAAQEGDGFEDSNHECEQDENNDLGSCEESDSVDAMSVEAEDDVEHGLPFPWSRLMDDESGLPYYFNEMTEESQWEHPVSGQ